MKAVTVVPRSKGTLALRDVDKPSPGAGELLLKVRRVGVCGTDIDIIAGSYGEAPKDSGYLILGHESLSTVEEVGRGAEGFAKGDLVVPTVRRSCPENCLNCRSGESDMCLTGHYTEHGIKGLHGFASEYALTDSRYVVKLPQSLSDVGVLLEPLTIVEKGVEQTYTMQLARMKWEPKRALVLGAGPVGLLATAALRLRGLQVDTVARKPGDSPKARLATSLGARYIDAVDKQLSTLGRVYDVVFEATGAASVALDAQDLVNVNGVVSYVGIYGTDVTTGDVGKVFTGLVLGNRLHFGSVNANISYFRKGVKDLVRMQGKWKGFLEGIITTKVPLASAERAYGAKLESEVKTILEI